MPFIAPNGLTEAGTSKTVAAGGMTVHYHDVGEGEPVLFLHSYGPGATAWITFHKTVGGLSQHFRCILMDLPNFSKTGPIVYRDGVHAVPRPSRSRDANEPPRPLPCPKWTDRLPRPKPRLPRSAGVGFCASTSSRSRPSAWSSRRSG